MIISLISVTVIRQNYNKTLKVFIVLMQTNHFLSKRKGNLGIGQNRYSTSGEKDDLQLAQPFVVHTSFGTLSVAHNGELVNSKKLRKKVLESGKCDF